MAKPTLELIRALRQTADRLSGPVNYRWTHMGACNCGHLAQTVTRLSPAEIHAFALERAGDWSEQVVDHCPSSGLPIDHIIDELLQLGLSPEDLGKLERLCDAEVVTAMGIRADEIDFRNRRHVVTYMRAWAEVLDARWASASSESGEERNRALVGV